MATTSLISSHPLFLTTPSTKVPDEDQLRPLKDAIGHNNIENLKDALKKLPADPEQAGAMLLWALDFACQQQSASSHWRKGIKAIKNELIDHPEFSVHIRCGTDIGYALDIAIRSDDVELAQKIFDKKADPEHFSHRYRSQEMRELLVFTRHKEILYRSAGENLEELDQALRDGHRGRAAMIFMQRLQNQPIDQVWAAAIEARDHETLRAILLLGHAKKNRGFRLSERSKVTDPDIKKVMNEIPHLSPKYGSPLCFNSEFEFAFFKGTYTEIACTTLAKDVQEQQAESPDMEADMSRYTSKKAISDNIPYERYVQYRNLMTHSDEAHLVSNRRFGVDFRLPQFLSMAEEGEGDKNRQMLLGASHHVRNMGMKTSKKESGIVYGTKAYDPNHTSNQLRSKTTSLAAIALEEMDSYMVSGTDEEDYHPEENGITRVDVRPKDSAHPANALTPQGPPAANRTLKSRVPNEEVDGTVLWHMLEGGFAGSVRELKELIRSLPRRKSRIILQAHVPKRSSGKEKAEQYKHEDTLKAYEELRQIVPPIAGSSYDSIPGLKEEVKRFSDSLSAENADAIISSLEKIADMADDLDRRGCVQLMVAMKRQHGGWIDQKFWMPDAAYNNLIAKYPHVGEEIQKFYRELDNMISDQ